MLEESLIEGAAEFTAELISGVVSYSYSRPRRKGVKKNLRLRSSRMKT